MSDLRMVDVRTQMRRDLAVEMYNRGASKAEMVEAVGICLRSVEKLIKGHVVPRRAPPAFTPEQRAEMLDLARAGMGAVEIAERTGLAADTIRGLLSRARARGELPRLTDEQRRAIATRAGTAGAAALWNGRQRQPKAPKVRKAHCWQRGNPIKGLKRQAQVPTGPRHPIPDFPPRHRCVYPEGNPGEADFHWCGKHAASGPYCKPHMARAYRPIT